MKHAIAAYLVIGICVATYINFHPPLNLPIHFGESKDPISWRFLFVLITVGWPLWLVIIIASLLLGLGA